MLLDIVKQIVTKNGEQILLDSKRVNAFFSDLAKDEPKPQKLAIIKCLEHDFVKVLKGVAKEELASCKENLAQRIRTEEGLDIELCREAIAILCEVLFGEKFLKPQNKDDEKFKPEDSLEPSPNIARRSDIEQEIKKCPFCGEMILAVAIKCKHCQSMLNELVTPSTASFVSTFTDPRDGKVYRTVKIGNQVWMAENLNYNASGSRYYEDNPANGDKYGRLYDWETAKKACPPGWHLPSYDEWKTLVDFAGGKKIAGKKLKAKNGWNENGNGTDEYGFSALPSGYAWDGFFTDAGCGSNWWSASGLFGFDYAYGLVMDYYGESALWNRYNESCLFSVRCLQGNFLSLLKEESQIDSRIYRHI